METEVSGEIREKEVVEAVLNGEAIEEYMDDEPYPSMLIYGKPRRKDLSTQYVHIQRKTI